MISPAGPRMHMLVCVRAAAFVITALESLPASRPDGASQLGSQVAAAIITGMGFLGGRGTQSIEEKGDD